MISYMIWYLFFLLLAVDNGSSITGNISWESYYSEDLMQELENVIGGDMVDYSKKGFMI